MSKREFEDIIKALDKDKDWKISDEDKEFALAELQWSLLDL